MSNVLPRIYLIVMVLACSSYFLLRNIGAAYLERGVEAYKDDFKIDGSPSDAADTGADSIIDVVILWVNGTDPLREHALKEYAHEASLDEAATPNRYREWNELYYSLRLLRKHASNLGTIFIVTGGERPYYADELGSVVWLDNRDFVPTIPTFSSYAVQFSLSMEMHRFTDPFVVMDDDCFVMRPFDLFDYAMSTMWYEEKYGREIGGTLSSSHQYVRSVQFTNYELYRVFPQHRPHNIPAHVPTVVRHTTMRWIVANMSDAFRSTTHSRFRSKTSLQFQYTLSNIERYTLPDVRFRHKDNVAMFVMMTDDIARLRLDLNNTLRVRPQFAVVNDDILTPQPEHSRVFSAFLNKILED